MEGTRRSLHRMNQVDGRTLAPFCHTARRTYSASDRVGLESHAGNRRSVEQENLRRLGFSENCIDYPP